MKKVNKRVYLYTTTDNVEYLQALANKLNTSITKVLHMIVDDSRKKKLSMDIHVGK